MKSSNAVITTFLAVLALGAASFATAHVAQEPKSSMNEEWVAKDFERARQVLAALGEKPLTVDALKKHVGASDVRDDRVIGFGARRLSIAVHGGYTTCWIHVLATAPDETGKSTIGELRCDQIGEAKKWSELAPRLRAAWGVRAKEIEFGLRVEWRDDLTSRVIRSESERALGAAGKVAVPDELRAAFDELTSPFEDLCLGKQYGDDGAPPPGRREVQALAAAGRWDLVRVALHGMNPEGRAWAAWALLDRAKPKGAVPGTKLDEADRAAIQTLSELPLEYATSHGCTMEHAKWVKALVAADE